MSVCPVSTQEIIGAMLRGECREMDEMDLEGFAGIEYDGFMAVIDGCTVVYDHGPSGIMVNVIDVDGNVWMVELVMYGGGGLIQIVGD